MRSHSCPRGGLGPLLSHAVFLQRGVPAGAASQAACGGYSPPPVRAASDRPRARSHGQSNPGRAVFTSLGSSSCSALGGRHRGAAGCSLALTHSCVSGPSFVFVHFCYHAAASGLTLGIHLHPHPSTLLLLRDKMAC